MLRRLHPLAACLLIGITRIGFCQTAAINGEITGSVSDPSGAAIAGATVQAVNLATGLTATAKTGNFGLYRVTLLPIGAYDLKVHANGFSDARVTGINVRAGATVTINVPLQVAGTTTEIEISANATLIEPS